MAKVTKKVAAKKITKKVTKKVAKKVLKKATSKKVVKKVTKKAPVKKKPMTKKASPKMSKLKVGDMAPDFTLQDQNGNTVSLHDFKEKNVVVYFYPKAMTPGCTVQACEIRNSESKLKNANIVVLGISADPVKSLKKFEEKEKLNFTLLSDPEKKVIQSYGSWGLKKFMGREFEGILRQSFLVDTQGKVAYVMEKVDTKTHHDDVLNFFKNH
jgi:peroxiredoxin Q/BCP